MKKIAIFLLGSMCMFNSAYAMQEKANGKCRPRSIELGSYFIQQRNCPTNSDEHATKADVIDDTTSSLYDFSPEWFKKMGKKANQIWSLDKKFVTRQEQLAGQICPEHDKGKFWEEFDEKWIATFEEQSASICPLNERDATYHRIYKAGLYKCKSNEILMRYALGDSLFKHLEKQNKIVD